MIESDKIALQNSTAAIRCKLIVKATDKLPEMVLTDGFELKENEYPSIKDWTYTDERYVPQQGFIGQFVARTLEGNLQDISEDFSIEGREVELQIGIIDFGERVIYMQTENGIQLMTETGEIIRLNQLGEDKINWYSYGNFIVTNPEDNEVSDNTKFEAMDYTKLFNKKFDGDFTNEEFKESLNTIIFVDSETGKPQGSVTALWLVKYVCAQVNVEFGQESFTNSDFIIDRNPFQAGETCRDVIKCIAQLALSWARIDWDNKCYIDFGENTMMLADDTTNIIDNNQYYTLDTKKEIYGPINAIYVGMENVDGTTLQIAKDDASIAANGEHPIYIYDNPLLYTPELRERLEVNGSGYKLIGLSYNQLTTETVGHPWLKGNEILTVVDMENRPKTTFAFNRTISYSGHIKTTLDSMGETEINETLAYESNVIRSAKNALLLVDKANGEITSLTEKTEEISSDLKDNYYTTTQVNTVVQNATKGWTNTYTSAGGNNRIRNSGLYFEDSAGFEYWEGNCEKIVYDMAISQTALKLQTGNFKQTINGLPRGEYTLSFEYEILNTLGVTKVIVTSSNVAKEFNLKTYISSKDNNALKAFDETFTVNENGTLIVAFETDVADACIVYDLICNAGLYALVWTQHPNEIVTDTVNISKGITITSSADKDVTFKANYDGVRIEDAEGNKTTQFTNRGMETEEGTIRGNATITNIKFIKIDRQTWITG